MTDLILQFKPPKKLGQVPVAKPFEQATRVTLGQLPGRIAQTPTIKQRSK